MDINQKDRAALNAKLCPDCGQPIRNYFFETNRPWCRACDVWFESDSSGSVIRNLGGTDQYNEDWVKMVREDGYFA